MYLLFFFVGSESEKERKKKFILNCIMCNFADHFGHFAGPKSIYCWWLLYVRQKCIVMIAVWFVRNFIKIYTKSLFGFNGWRLLLHCFIKSNSFMRDSEFTLMTKFFGGFFCSFLRKKIYESVTDHCSSSDINKSINHHHFLLFFSFSL